MHQHATDGAKATTHGPSPGGAGVLDPVCGMTVDPAATPHHAEHGGATYHFCSTSCAAKFRATPEPYLAGKREAPAPNLMIGPGMGPEVARDLRPAVPLPALPDFVAAAIAEPKSGGVGRKIAVRKLSAEEQSWVDERAKQFERTPEEMAMLLAQANYVARDAQRALELERDHGRGGNRAWVRGAEEILDLKQRSDRLSWLDVRGVLMRAGEMFTPVNDPVDLIHGLRTKFSWDELDPMFDDDKWGRKKLADEIARREAARAAHPLGVGDKARQVLYQVDFGAAGKGALPMESIGWKSLPGREWDLARRQYYGSAGESR